MKNKILLWIAAGLLALSFVLELLTNISSLIKSPVDLVVFFVGLAVLGVYLILSLAKQIKDFHDAWGK